MKRPADGPGTTERPSGQAGPAVNQSDGSMRQGDDGRSAARFAGKTAVRGVRWSFTAVLAKQGFQIICAVVLARILGPESYGVISAATIYTTLAALLLDQGLSAALVQKETVTRRAAGATATLNVLIAIVIGGATLLAAPAVADFFNAEGIALLLVPLAAAIPLKALEITPRAMLSRHLLLHHIGKADIAGAAVGAVAGISAALLGAGYFALAYQVVATDFITAVLLLTAARGPWPTFHFKELKPMLAFSLSVFLTNCLAYFSRNTDNILVGRFLGIGSLSLYSMAYRIMVIPIQLVGQTVNRTMFPAFSRAKEEPAKIADHLTKATQVVAMTVLPVMAYVACASFPLVHLVLGEAWLPAAAIVSVLAIGGVRETLFYITPSLMKGLGKASLIVRYEILAAMAQVGGIIVGLQFGLLGVAIGLVAGGFLLVPVLLIVQSRLSGLRIRDQLRVIWPAVHAAIWASTAYLGVAVLEFPSLPTAALGLLAFTGIYLLVLFLVHRRHLIAFLKDARSLFARQVP